MSGKEESVRNICLFCLQTITGSEYSVYDEIDLKIGLDESSKNHDALDLICTLLHINFKNRLKNKCPPLCQKCQSLYQEVLLLHVQVKELERLLKEKVDSIVTLVCESDLKQQEDGSVDMTPLSSLGLDSFRDKVLHLRFSNGKKLQTKIQQPIGIPGLGISLHPEPNFNLPLQPVENTLMKADPPQHMRLETCLSGLEEALGVLPWGNDIDNVTFPDIGSAFDEDSSLVRLITEAYFDEDSRGGIENLTNESEDKKITFMKPHNDLAITAHEHGEFSGDNCTAGLTLHSDFSETEPKNLLGEHNVECMNDENNGEETNAFSFLKCQNCSETTNDSFGKHYAENHPDETKFTCVHCKKLFMDLRGILPHQNQHQVDQTEDKVGSNSTDPKMNLAVNANVETPAVTCESESISPECHLGNDVIVGASLFEEHYNEKHPKENKFSCKYCKLFFTSAQDALSHQRNQHDNAELEHDKSKVFESEILASAPSSGKVKENGNDQNRGTLNTTQTKIICKCHLCDEEIIGAGPLRAHYNKKHPDEKKYSCKFCKKHFVRLRDVEAHQRQAHTGEKPYHCVQCNKDFVSKRQQKNHEKRFHNPNAALLSCEQCGKIFPTESALSYHRESHSDTIVICLTCGGSYISKQAFQVHNKKMHESKANCSEPLRDPSDEQIEALGVKIKGKMRCFVCWNFLLGTRNVERHFQEKHPETCISKCPQCDKIIPSYKDLFKHVYRHFGSRTVQCDKCPMKFFTNGELNHHLKVHKPIKEKFGHLCQICGHSFASRHSLQQHTKRKHDPAGVSKFMCELCGKSYSDKKGYMTHKKSAHSGNLEHKCPNCPKAFVFLWELRKHMKSKTHADQQPFKCPQPQCEMTFLYSSSRRRHVQEVHQKKVRMTNKPKDSANDTLAATPPHVHFLQSMAAETEEIPGSSQANLNNAIVLHEQITPIPILQDNSQVDSGALNTFPAVQWDGHFILEATPIVFTFQPTSESGFTC